MTTAPSTTRPRREARPVPPTPRWRHWLLLGVLFGLGYGVTQRLLDFRWEEDTNRPPAFRSKASSGGTSLKELRRGHDDKSKELTADLETLAREKREEQEKKEAAKREEAARLEAARKEEKDRMESERRRLESFNSPPPTSEPVRQEDSLFLTPPTPELPAPEPSAGQPAFPPSSQPSTEATPSPP